MIINHGVLDVCKFALMFVTCLVTAILLEKLFTCPQECAKLDRRFPVLSASVSSRNIVRKDLGCFNTSSFSCTWNWGVQGSERTKSEQEKGSVAAGKSRKEGEENSAAFAKDRIGARCLVSSCDSRGTLACLSARQVELRWNPSLLAMFTACSTSKWGPFSMQRSGKNRWKL